MSHPALSSLIRNWRRRAGVSQSALGSQVGVTQALISRWECGGEVPASHWPALADALQLSEAETEQLRAALLDQYAVQAA